MRIRCALLVFLELLGPIAAAAEVAVIEPRLRHLRAGAVREWSDFPADPEASSLDLRFRADRNDAEWSLRLRQQDVKQTWSVRLNGEELGRLLNDESDMVVYYPVPRGSLAAGDNQLRIEPKGPAPDDLRVGEIVLDDLPLAAVLSQATVEVAVLDASQPGKAVPTPCRITVLNDRGALMTVGAASGPGFAVRPGVLYSRDGKARFGLPPGDYSLCAGRGFEYGVDTIRVALQAGNIVRRTLTVRREVPTDGHVSCDTHTHTLTHSGHGDATSDERMLTLAGEGVELPIATDHNVQVDYHETAVRMGVREYFTPVVGNEVTTDVGHFNIFPVRVGGPVPDHRAKDWTAVFATIAERTGARVIVLNHPRDIHSGFQPFGAVRHISLTGECLDGWDLRANAVEIVNSGAQHSDVMQPVHDWMGLLNRGLSIAPVGSSDSHDVSRYIVGQGRTYVRCNDRHPGAIDVDAVVRSFSEGRVLVSCGLLADIAVDGKYGPGDLAPGDSDGDVRVQVRVLGPGWVTADKAELFANGCKIREASIGDGRRPGVKFSKEWLLPRLRHDVYLVAVASGPGVTDLFWPIAKPYQPISPVLTRRVIGVTGAVWLDGDGDGQRTSARDYAERLLGQANGDWQVLLPKLSEYDEAVVVQAAALLRGRGVNLTDPAVHKAAEEAGTHVQRGLQAYAEAWRRSQIAQAESQR